VRNNASVDSDTANQCSPGIPEDYSALPFFKYNKRITREFFTMAEGIHYLLYI